MCECMCVFLTCSLVFFFKQKTAYEMRISDWSSDVCSSDLKRMHSQSPKSRLIRIVSNITVAASGGSDVLVSSNFILGEARSGQHQSLFARATHLLKQGADGFKILGKKVYLINNVAPMRNVTFLL